jgi:hypothetical protein
MARAKSKAQTSSTQKQASDLMAALLPDAVALLLQVINDETLGVKERLTAAKLVVDRVVPAASTYADESILNKTQEEEDSLLVLARELKSFSDKTRKRN